MVNLRLEPCLCFLSLTIRSYIHRILVILMKEKSIRLKDKKKH